MEGRDIARSACVNVDVGESDRKKVFSRSAWKSRGAAATSRCVLAGPLTHPVMMYDILQEARGGTPPDCWASSAQRLRVHLSKRQIGSWRGPEKIKNSSPFPHHSVSEIASFDVRQAVFLALCSFLDGRSIKHDVNFKKNVFCFNIYTMWLLHLNHLWSFGVNLAQAKRDGDVISRAGTLLFKMCAMTAWAVWKLTPVVS